MRLYFHVYGNGWMQFSTENDIRVENVEEVLEDIVVRGLRIQREISVEGDQGTISYFVEV